MKKVDEKEMECIFKSIRISWIYVLIVLNLWIIYDLIKTGDLNAMPAFLLNSSMVIFWFSKDYFKKTQKTLKAYSYVNCNNYCNLRFGT